MFYLQAEKYNKEKLIMHQPKPFMKEIVPELEDKVYDALVMVENGDISGGEAIISGLLKNYSHIDKVQYGMGAICLAKEQPDEAIVYFDKTNEINPYFVEAWYNKGIIYQNRLDITNVIICFKKVIEFGDKSKRIVVQAKRIIKTIEKQIRKENNLSLDEYIGLMDIYTDAFVAMEKMEWKKAIFGFNKVLTKDPKHTQSYGNLGLCYAHLGEKQKALNNLNKALELDPNYGPVLSNLSVISSLKDGEKLPPSKYKSVEYYKDIALNEKKQVNK